MTALTTAEIVRQVERDLGIIIEEDRARYVLDYSKNKLEVAGLDDDYLPILFENELHDYYMGLTINLRGAMNRVGRTD